MIAFIETLAVCHTVMVERDKDTNELKYSASSPDELALVKGASQLGIIFSERTSNIVKITYDSTQETKEYEILAEFPFDSDRKRMSLLVSHQNRYILMTKGADSVMLPLLNFEN